jgi:hypothetical protein
MRAIITIAAVLVLASELAFGQTTRTSPSASSTIPSIPSSSSTSAADPCYSSTNPTSPCYSGTATPSYSAITPYHANTPQTSITPYSATAPTLTSPKEAEPKAAGHSFTADQAKSKIESKGYSNVSDLQRDSKGAWRGKAVKDGKPLSVILDFEGNIVAN